MEAMIDHLIVIRHTVDLIVDSIVGLGIHLSIRLDSQVLATAELHTVSLSSFKSNLEVGSLAGSYQFTILSNELSIEGTGNLESAIGTVDNPALVLAVVLGCCLGCSDVILGSRVGQGVAVVFKGEIAALGQRTNDLLEAIFEVQGVLKGLLAVWHWWSSRGVGRFTETGTIKVAVRVSVRSLGSGNLRNAVIRLFDGQFRLPENLRNERKAYVGKVKSIGKVTHILTAPSCHALELNIAVALGCEPLLNKENLGVVVTVLAKYASTTSPG